MDTSSSARGRPGKPATRWLKTAAICTARLTEPEDSLNGLVERFGQSHPVYMNICTQNGETSVIINGENQSQRQLRICATTNEHMMKSFACYLCRGRLLARPEDTFTQLKNEAMLRPHGHNASLSQISKIISHRKSRRTDTAFSGQIVTEKTSSTN